MVAAVCARLPLQRVAKWRQQQRVVGQCYLGFVVVSAGLRVIGVLAMTGARCSTTEQGSMTMELK